MNQTEITQLFHQQAPQYDANWESVSPIKDAMHLMIQASFSELPHDARILCVGAGTGQEVLYLANAFPGFRFTVVEPAVAMIERCKAQLTQQGYESRCSFHQGYLDTLTEQPLHDAATCLLVSHFLVIEAQRTALFREIFNNLKPGGRLFNADLSADKNAANYSSLVELWVSVLARSGMSEEQKQEMIASYDQDVALVPAQKVASMMEKAGFEQPVVCFQAGMIQGLVAIRGGSD